MANWFECKVRYDKMMENGRVKKVNETFLVDALSFTDAEARIIEERTPFISGDFTVSAVKRSGITEIFYGSNPNNDYWYLAKVSFVTIDEKTAAEKTKISQILVAGNDLKQGFDNFNESMKGTLGDYELLYLAKSAILEVYKAKLESVSKK